MKIKKYALYKHSLIDKLIGGNKTRKKDRSPGYSVEDLNKMINKAEFVQNEFPIICAGYPYTPAIFAKQRRIVVLGDIHGDYKLMIKMLQLAKVIHINNNDVQWIGGTTHIVQVGDQIDRCRPIGNMTCDKPNTTYQDESSDIKILKLFTELDKQAIIHGGRVISLFGNHELLNAQGNMSYVSFEGIKEFENYKDPNNENLQFKTPMDARIHAFAPDHEIGKLLGCTRLPAVIIGSNLFVHAGIISSVVSFLKIHHETDLETINVAIKKWLLGMINKDYIGKIIASSSKSMFWTRILGNLPPDVNMNDKRCMDSIGDVLGILKIGHMVVGHTPQSFTYSKTINSTCDGAVWRVDNGSSSAFHKFDYTFLNTGVVDENRKPQVLEIIDDEIYNVLM
jgi:hypothetical protein